MRKILNQEFEVKGCLFCITNNRKRSEYEGKYKLLMFVDWLDNGNGAWVQKTTDDSLRFLKKYAEENALYLREVR